MSHERFVIRGDEVSRTNMFGNTAFNEPQTVREKKGFVRNVFTNITNRCVDNTTFRNICMNKSDSISSSYPFTDEWNSMVSVNSFNKTIGFSSTFSRSLNAMKSFLMLLAKKTPIPIENQKVYRIRMEFGYQNLYNHECQWTFQAEWKRKRWFEKHYKSS